MRQRATGNAVATAIATAIVITVATTVAAVCINIALTLPRGRRGSQGAVFAGVSVFLLHCRVPSFLR